ncbi:MAG: hypothetical protein MZV70_64295 [Desulfobacterales bacterium]|nr:hypothetical protein [Desulfobacterales bacterium]
MVGAARLGEKGRGRHAADEAEDRCRLTRTSCRADFRIGVDRRRQLGHDAGRPARRARASRWTCGCSSPRSSSRSTRCA